MTGGEDGTYAAQIEHLARAHQHPAEDVPAEVVGTEEVSGTGRLKPGGHVLVGIAVRGQEWSEHGDQQEEDKDDSSGQPDRLPAEPPPVGGGSPVFHTLGSVSVDALDRPGLSITSSGRRYGTWSATSRARC